MNHSKKIILFLCSLCIAIGAGYYATAQKVENFRFAIDMTAPSTLETLNLASRGLPKAILQAGQFRINVDRNSLQNSSSEPLQLQITLSGISSHLKTYTKTNGWQAMDSPWNVTIAPGERLMLCIETNLAWREARQPIVGNIELNVQELNQQKRIHHHTFHLVNL